MKVEGTETMVSVRRFHSVQLMKRMIDLNQFLWTELQEGMGDDVLGWYMYVQPVGYVLLLTYRTALSQRLRVQAVPAFTVNFKTFSQLLLSRFGSLGILMKDSIA